MTAMTSNGTTVVPQFAMTTSTQQGVIRDEYTSLKRCMRIVHRIDRPDDCHVVFETEREPRQFTAYRHALAYVMGELGIL